jgi:hypothetical protein
LKQGSQHTHSAAGRRGSTSFLKITGLRSGRTKFKFRNRFQHSRTRV